MLLGACSGTRVAANSFRRAFGPLGHTRLRPVKATDATTAFVRVLWQVWTPKTSILLAGAHMLLSQVPLRWNASFVPFRLLFCFSFRGCLHVFAFCACKRSAQRTWISWSISNGRLSVAAAPSRLARSRSISGQCALQSTTPAGNRQALTKCRNSNPSMPSRRRSANTARQGRWSSSCNALAGCSVQRASKPRSCSSLTSVRPPKGSASRTSTHMEDALVPRVTKANGTPEAISEKIYAILFQLRRLDNQTKWYGPNLLDAACRLIGSVPTKCWHPWTSGTRRRFLLC